MKQELYAVEDYTTGEVHFFFCKWDAQNYHDARESKTRPPVKITL